MGYVLFSSIDAREQHYSHTISRAGWCIAGSYALLFITSVVLLLRRLRAPRRNLNVSIFIANCLLFASCTAHFALEFNHFYRTLVSATPSHESARMN